MGVQAVFVVLLMFAAAVKAGGDVTFSKKTVTLTCPEEGKWYDGEQVVGNNPTETYKFEFKGTAQYSCEYKENEETRRYHFYIKGKACEHCFELDGLLFMMVIILDVLGTAVFMMIVFKWAKKKRSNGPPPPPRSPARPRGRGPPDASSTYQSLNPNTLTVDTYSTVVNRTG